MTSLAIFFAKKGYGSVIFFSIVVSSFVLFFLFLEFVSRGNEIKGLREENRRLKNRELEEIEKKRKDAENLRKEAEITMLKASKKATYAERISEAAEKAIVERQKGFPYIAEKLSEFRAQLFINPDAYMYLRKKAWKTKEIADELKAKYREVNKRLIISENLIAFYEYVYPDLIELKEQEIEKECVVDKSYSRQELEADPDTHFIPKREYLLLSQCGRGQLALDRYWKRQKSKKEVGNAYERFIGFLFERWGYDVDFVGITKGVKDRGIDLVCENENEILLVQCKNWAKYKKIHENVLFQFFGAVFHARERYRKTGSIYDEEKTERFVYPKREKNVSGIIYSTVTLSEFAKEAISKLGIGLEVLAMDYNYPCIKCNVNNGNRIYHLPFDQQYDKTKIKMNDLYSEECYVKTCKEAEELGFRRAKKFNLRTNGLIKT